MNNKATKRSVTLSRSTTLKNYAFTIILVTCIIIGGVCGILFKEDTAIVKPIGELFLNLIFMLIVPLVFLSVSSAICNMKQSNMVGKVMRNMIVIFVGSAVIVASIAYVVTLFYNPLENIDKNLIAATLPNHLYISKMSTGEMLVRTFTVSDFSQLLSKSNLLPLIIFSIFFGLGTAYIGDKGKPVAAFLNSANEVILKMMNIIMYAAPIGLGCYFADTVGQVGAQILGSYGHVFVLYLILTVICFFGLNSVYTYIAGGKRAFVLFWKNMLTPSLTAIATSSSAACMPVNIEAAKRMGVSPSIAETVIPLGTNLHKDGSVMGGVIKIIFLLTVCGSEAMISNNIFMVIGVALLVGAVMGAIPSGGMTGELLICSVFGFPPQMAATLMIISTIIDIPATLLNSTGNISCSMLVARLSEGKGWIKEQLTSKQTI